MMLIHPAGSVAAIAAVTGISAIINTESIRYTIINGNDLRAILVTPRFVNCARWCSPPFFFTTDSGRVDLIGQPIDSSVSPACKSSSLPDRPSNRCRFRCRKTPPLGRRSECGVDYDKDNEEA